MCIMYFRDFRHVAAVAPDATGCALLERRGGWSKLPPWAGWSRGTAARWHGEVVVCSLTDRITHNICNIEYHAHTPPTYIYIIMYMYRHFLMHMYMYMYLCLYMYMYIYMYMYTYMHMCVMRICVCIYIYIHVYEICIGICIGVCVCMCVFDYCRFIYIYMYFIHIDIHMYKYIYIYIFIYTSLVALLVSSQHTSRFTRAEVEYELLPTQFSSGGWAVAKAHRTGNWELPDAKFCTIATHQRK